MINYEIIMLEPVRKRYYILIKLGIILLLILLIKSSQQQKEKLPMKKLIAFGDSLTRGHQTYKETPYIDFLKPLLGKGWVLENKGINGELTTQMLTRFERDVMRHRPDVVVILGGTNDIGWGIDNKIIIKNLKAMIQKALDKKITPVICAIPSLRGFGRLVPPRQEVNTAISQFAQEKNIAFVDLFTITADENLWLAGKYADDGLHLNTEGYKLIAETIYQQALKEIVHHRDLSGQSLPLPGAESTE
jgi:lysophospholipase L1-like esterase